MNEEPTLVSQAYRYKLNLSLINILSHFICFLRDLFRSWRFTSSRIHRLSLLKEENWINERNSIEIDTESNEIHQKFIRRQFCLPISFILNFDVSLFGMTEGRLNLNRRQKLFFLNSWEKMFTGNYCFFLIKFLYSNFCCFLL